MKRAHFAKWLPWKCENPNLMPVMVVHACNPIAGIEEIARCLRLAKLYATEGPRLKKQKDA